MNHFTLELDTTGPRIEILAPAYTTPSIDTHIRIISDEPLDLFQEIFVIDSLGRRHDFIFLHKETELEGLVRLNNISPGIVTLYVQLRDTTHNLSNLASKAILLLASGALNLEISERVRNISLRDEARALSFGEISQRVRPTTHYRGPFTEELIRNLEFEVRNP